MTAQAGKILRIHISEGDKHQGKPLCEAIGCRRSSNGVSIGTKPRSTNFGMGSKPSRPGKPRPAPVFLHEAPVDTETPSSQPQMPSLCCRKATDGND